MAVRPIPQRMLSRKDTLDLESVTEWFRSFDFTWFEADTHTAILMHPSWFRALIAAHGGHVQTDIPGLGEYSWLDHVVIAPAVWVRRGDYSIEPLGPLSNVYTADAR